MAVPIQEFTIIEVRKPNVGENKPADVTADIAIDTSSEPSLAPVSMGLLPNALRGTTDLVWLCLCLQQGCSYSQPLQAACLQSVLVASCHADRGIF